MKTQFTIKNCLNINVTSHPTENRLMAAYGRGEGHVRKGDGIKRYKLPGVQ